MRRVNVYGFVRTVRWARKRILLDEIGLGEAAAKQKSDAHERAPTQRAHAINIRS